MPGKGENMFQGYGTDYYHGAPIWYAEKEFYFICLDFDNQQMAVIVKDGNRMRVNRDLLSPRKIKTDRN